MIPTIIKSKTDSSAILARAYIDLNCSKGNNNWFEVCPKCGLVGKPAITKVDSSLFNTPQNTRTYVCSCGTKWYKVG